jgi:hypothetical protein
MAVFLGAFVSNSYQAFWIGEAVPAVVAVTFLLIQLRVGLGLSSWEHNAAISSAEGRSRTQSTVVTVHVMRESDADSINIQNLKGHVGGDV